MPPVKFAHPGRRRLLCDTLPAPKVRLRETRAHDDLDSARGVLMGVLIGITLWVGILCASFIWN